MRTGQHRQTHEVDVLVDEGVARVYTPKDFRVSDIVAELADLVTPDEVG